MNISIIGLILVLGNITQDSLVQELQEMVQELRAEVAELKDEKQNENWLNEQRADEVRALVNDVLADADYRTNLQGSSMLAGYDGGAFLQSADGNWKLKIGGQIQSRWMYNKADDQTLLGNEDTQHGFDQRRTKVKFSGHVIDPSWQYKITQTWSRDGGSNTEDAYIAKKMENGGWLKFGQFKGRFLRENIVSSSKQLTVERSMLDNAFTYGWTQGIELGWKNDDVRLTAQYTDGPGQSNTAGLADPTNAWTLRGELRFGEAGWKDFDYLTSKNGSKEGLLLGVAYQNFDRNTQDNTADIEYGNADAFQSSGWTVDASWRGDGWNLFAYYVEAEGKDFTGANKQSSDGWLVQAGVMANEHVELFAQYQNGSINNATWENGSNSMDATRVGFNYWPQAGSNMVKWTTDVAWAGSSIAAGSSDSGIASAAWDSTGNGWRQDQGNNDGQMLLRTQLQLLF